MADRFDKFSERARRVLTLAQEEAQRFNHNYIGTEHLLLGLIREEEGLAAKVLANLGVKLSAVRSAVEFIIGRGDRAILGEIGLTPRAKTVIELAVDEARRLNNGYIGTEHLLLGLVREGEGIAAGVLVSLGVTFERVRAEVGRAIGGQAQQGQTALQNSGQRLMPVQASRRPASSTESGPLEAMHRAWMALQEAKDAALDAGQLERAAELRKLELQLERQMEAVRAEVFRAESQSPAQADPQVVLEALRRQVERVRQQAAEAEAAGDTERAAERSRLVENLEGMIARLEARQGEAIERQVERQESTAEQRPEQEAENAPDESDKQEEKDG